MLLFCTKLLWVKRVPGVRKTEAPSGLYLDKEITLVNAVKV